MAKAPPSTPRRSADEARPSIDPQRLLREARQHLYTAFEPLAFDATMSRSPGSVSDRDLTELGRPVRSLAPETVARFLLKAGTTWGRPRDIRRIMPRALDLAADNQLPIDRGLLWAKARWAGWPDWPTYQALTVREFLSAEWGRLIRSEPRPAHVAHGWLGQVSDAVEDLDPFLDDWLQAMSADAPMPYQRVAAGHLVALLVLSPLRPDVPQSIRSLFRRRGQVVDQFTTWLTGPDVELAVERAQTVLADTNDRRRVTLAAQRLTRLRLAVEDAGPPQS